MKILLIFLFSCFILAIAVIILIMYEIKFRKSRNNVKKQNKVHFYVARDKEGDLTMWLGKPYRHRGYWVSIYNSVLIASSDNKLNSYGIDIRKYDNLKLEDGPIEVFLNMEG